MKTTNKERQGWKATNVASLGLGMVLLIAATGCGTFTPVQGTLTGGGSTTVCGYPVSGTYTRFSNPYLTQTPDTGYTGFQGRVIDTTTSTTIANTDYYLQWFINSLPENNGCCTNVTGSATDIGCKVKPGQPYRFTAFFKTGHVPSSGHQLELQGSWTH
jgi:hypothetical protein